MSTSELARLTAMERLKAGELTQAQVARQLGISVRQVKRLWRAYRVGGAAALASKRRGVPSNRRTESTLLANAMALVREHYHDFGPTFAAEKLFERHGIRLDHETLRRAMIETALWSPRHRPKRTVHPPRERRPLFGELVQIDGSHHPWFEKRAPKCTLYVAVDDATSSLVGLHFAEQETTLGYFELARQHMLEHGVPLAYYSDKYGVFRINVACRQERAETQFGRAMRQLDVEHICANSPQAKGRVERANSTLQKRLVRELRLRNISTIAEANAYAPEFISWYNGKYAKLPAGDSDAHRPVLNCEELERILSVQEVRRVSKNLTVQFGNHIYELLTPHLARRLAHTNVIVRRDRLGSIAIERNGVGLPYRLALTQQHPPILDAKALEQRQPANRRVPNPKKAHTPPMAHPWKFPSYRAGSRGHL